MELNEIKQYQHKIKIINVHNNNKQSAYKFVVVKINLPSSNDETVRFSLEPNDHFVEHQHISDTNDYYCDIPNYLDQTITLYAHFFPSDLYEYDTELDSLILIYDLQDILIDAEITHYRYNAIMDDRGNLIIQSTDTNSVNNVHDPNYKEYSDINNIKNKTEQGFFPLSGKYRSKKNLKVPDIQTAKPSWRENNNKVFWEARIPIDYATSPMKVFINYEYLPTSREYHQHYFGFEGTTQNNNTINVLEGTNINILDDKFGSKNNYRLINLGNQYSDKNSIYVPHENIIPINLKDFTPKFFNNQKTCEWKKSKCQDYYIYTPLSFSANQDGYCLKQISLTPGKYYSLRYYIYIPSYAHVEDDKCHIVIETDENITYKIDDAFILKDKEMRNKWIYHEVPFLATENNNIKIIGPQSFNTSTDKNNNIFFTNISLYEMVEYSPTLQYTNTSLKIFEKDQKTLRLISEPNTTQSISPDDKTWTLTNNILPTPYNDVYITTDEEEEIYYELYSTDLLYTHSLNDNNAISYNSVTTDITLRNNDYATLTYDDQETIIYVEYDYKIKGVYGPGNNFTFNFRDIDGNVITIGEVEAGIFLTKDSVSNINTAEKKLSYNSVKVQGQVTFSNIDLTNLRQNNPIANKYYIRLDYTHPCLEGKKTIFKTLYLYKEEVIIDNLKIGSAKNLDGIYIHDITINNDGNLVVDEIRKLEINNTEIINDLNITGAGELEKEFTTYTNGTDAITHGATSLMIADGKLIISFEDDEYIYATQNDILANGYTINDIDQLPLKIEARIVDQEGNIKTTGYCELSIDDKLNQTTIVDNGWVDFYLDLADFKPGCQTIKIEYYREYYRSLDFIYFDICLNESINTKDYIPIDIKVLEKGNVQSLKNNSYKIAKDDCLLSSIDVHNYSQFRVEVYKDNNLILKKNIYNRNSDDIVFFSHEYGDKQSHQFTIKTGNMLDENGEIIEDLYRDHQKTFVINK